MWKFKGPKLVKTILIKNKLGRPILPDKTYYKTTVIRMVCSWHQSRQLDQWNRREHPEIDLHIHGQLIFDKSARKIQWRKKFFFLDKW